MDDPTSNDDSPSDPGISDADMDHYMSGRLRPPRRWRAIHRAEPTGNVVDLTALPAPDVPPHRRLLFLLLLLAIKDRAAKVHFEPTPPSDEVAGMLLQYKVDGELLDLVPPPRGIADWLMREVEMLAGYLTYRRRVGSALRRLAGRIDGQPPGWEFGRFGLRLASAILTIDLWTYPSILGNRLFLHLPPISVAASDEAWATLRAVCGTWPNEAAPPPAESPAVV